MENWQKTGCVLCAQNCGLEVLVEDNRMVKVRPDKDNPRSLTQRLRKKAIYGWKLIGWQGQAALPVIVNPGPPQANNAFR